MTTRKPRKPRPIVVEPFRAFASRQPCKSDRRWAWRVRETGRPGDAWSGRGTRAEVRERMLALKPGVLEEPDAGPDTVGELLRLWLASQKHRRDHKHSDLSSISYDSYLRSAKAVASRIGEIRLPHVTPRTLATMWVQCNRTHAYSTCEHEINILRMAWKWGHKRGHTPGPIPEWTVPEGEKPSRPTPTEEQALAVLAYLQENGPEWRYLAYLVALSTGARVSEIGALTTADIEPLRIRLHRKGKGGNRKPVVWVPIPHGLYAQLHHLLSDPGASIWPVTPGTLALTKRLNDACKAVGCPPHGWHGPRRLAATRLIEAGTDRLTYEALMGHKYEVGVSIYAQARNTEKAAAVLGVALPGKVLAFPAKKA